MVMEQRTDEERQTAIDKRRVKLLRITSDMLVEILKDCDVYWLKVVENPLPADARAIGAEYDVIHGCWKMGIWSSTFDPVDPAVEAPELPAPTVGRRYPTPPDSWQEARA